VNKLRKYDDCSSCGGRVSERSIQKVCYWGNKIIAVIDNVPAGVCEQCGEKYYRVSVLKQIEGKIKSKKKLSIIKIPLVQFAVR